METEMEFEEVVACSFQPFFNPFTKKVMENIGNYMEVSPWTQLSTPFQVISSEEFQNLGGDHQGRFEVNKEDKFSYRIIHDKTNRHDSEISVKRLTRSKEEVKLKMTEEHQFKSHYSFWANSRYWTVLAYTKKSFVKRFICIDLQSMKLVSNLKLHESILGDHWRVLSIEGGSMKVIEASGKPWTTSVCIYNLNSGVEEDRFDLDQNSAVNFHKNGLVYTVSQKKSLSTCFDYRNWSLVSSLSLEISKEYAGGTWISDLNGNILVMFANDVKGFNLVLIDRESSKVRSQIEIKKLATCTSYPDSLPRGPVDLFKIKNHSVKLVWLYSNPTVFLLVSEVNGKLVYTFLKAAFPGMRLYTVETSKKASKHLYHLEGYGKLESKPFQSSIPVTADLRVRKTAKKNGIFSVVHP